VGYGGVRFRRLGEARRGSVWQGKDWQARLGGAGQGMFRFGNAGGEWHGKVRPDTARRGIARQARHGLDGHGVDGHGLAGKVRNGMDWSGQAQYGRRGKARFGLDGTGEVWQAWLG
jgi:hypothetical protein